MIPTFGVGVVNVVAAPATGACATTAMLATQVAIRVAVTGERRRPRSLELPILLGSRSSREGMGMTSCGVSPKGFGGHLLRRLASRWGRGPASRGLGTAGLVTGRGLCHWCLCASATRYALGARKLPSRDVFSSTLRATSSLRSADQRPSPESLLRACKSGP